MSFSFRGRGQVSRQISFQQYGGRRGQDQIVAMASDFLSANPSGSTGGSGAPVSTTLTADTAAHTFGAWTQLVASTGFDVSVLRILTEGVSASTVATGTILDIGVGASGSEVSIAQIAIGSHSLYQSVLPIFISNGTRISGRIQSVVTGGKTAIVRLGFIPTVGDFRPASYVDVYGINLATSRGANIPSSASPLTTYDEVTASTTRAYRMLTAVWSASNGTLNNANEIFRIAVGPAGSETVIAYQRARSSTAEAIFNDLFQMPLLYVGNIPAGSRLSCGLLSGDAYFDVTLIGIP